VSDRRARPGQAWEDGAYQLRIAQQHAGIPEHGLVFRVEQRTTLAGRAVLLTPQQVAEVHAWLGEWLEKAVSG
jgi:hypothetical protein